MAARTSGPFRSDDARERYLVYYAAQEAGWPVPSETLTLRTAHGETYVRVSGPEDAPPLVLLPGGRCPSLVWAPMMEQLSERFRTYALDAIYDVGRSAASRPISSPADVTAWLDGVLDGLGLTDRVRMMGLSLGGWSTAQYVLHAPDRVAKAVWLSPAGVTGQISGGFIRRSIMCAIPSKATFGAFMGWVFADAARSDGAARALYDTAVEDLAMSGRCFRMLPFPGGPGPLDDAQLRAVRVPVLYMVGMTDRVMADVPAAVDRARSLVPGIEIEAVPGVGHDLSFMRPERVADRVVRFLSA